MKNYLKWALLLFGVLSMEARDKTYFQQAKAAIVGIYDQYVQWQQEKIKKQEEKEKEEKEHQEFMQQVMKDAECIKQEQKKLEEEEKIYREEKYKYYFEQQERIYQALVNGGIPGARPLSIDADLAESVLNISSKKVRDIVIDIEQRVLFKNKKNIIFYGPSGTGKSVLAQAIAIKSQIPCLFFNAGTISTEYMNSGVQNLSKIAQCAEELARQMGQPCMIIFDELESLTKKHAETSNHENNILISFWQELDALSNSQVIVIGTMNSVDDVPEQVINRTCMINIPLPTQKQREAIISYHLKKIQNMYNLEYPAFLTAAYIAVRTQGFSNRDLENVIIEALRPSIRTLSVSHKNNRRVNVDDVMYAIKQIRQDFIDKWKRTFNQYLFDSRIMIPVAGLVLTTVGLCIQIMAMRQAQTIASMQMNQAQALASMQMNQSSIIAEQQMSVRSIAKATTVHTIIASQIAFIGKLLKAYL